METIQAPIEKLTKGPTFHWFAYYDKFQFDPTDRYVLSNEVDFEGRMPEIGDEIRVGVIDRENGNAWKELGTSTAWCWQQGCMLQFLPGSDSKVIWNDRGDGHYISHIMDIHTGEKRTIQHPVYSVSPTGREAVTPDFRRINDTRPGYGYEGFPDPYADVLTPDDSGIWRVSLETGKADLIISVAQMAAIPYPFGDLSGAKHYFNHLLFNTDGSRFEFLHRWIDNEGKFHTRMFTAAPDGSDIRLVTNGAGQAVSHFIWRDPDTLNVWEGGPEHGFVLYPDDNSQQGTRILDARDGHQSHLPGHEDWMVYDAYPDAENKRPLLLLHIPTGRTVEVGRFLSPPEYGGPLRCDLHPRTSRSGTLLTIDSVHEGDGRQIYLLDIREIIG